MNGKDILTGLGNIDESFIEEAVSEKTSRNNKTIKWAAPMAACFAVVVLLAALSQNGDGALQIHSGENKSSPTGVETVTGYSLRLNQAAAMSANRVMIQGHFWKELSAEQTAAVLPVVSGKYAVTGTVHYSSTANRAALEYVDASAEIDESISGTIRISPRKAEFGCYIIDGEPILSEIEGVTVNAGLYIMDGNNQGEKEYSYYADFKMDGIFYHAELTSENKRVDDVFTAFVADVILGGKADLSVFDNPEIPKIIEKVLTENEAHNEADFGKYLFAIPNDYAFNGAHRLLNQSHDFLLASWSKGYDDVRITVSKLNEESKARMVSPEDTKLYDMSLYPIPWADSMPRDKYQIIENPVFRAEDLTLHMIRMREYTRGEADEGVSVRFSVLYGDVVVEVDAEGLSAEYLLEALTVLADK